MRIEPRADGLPVPVVGRWSKRKYHFLGRYLQLFSTGTKFKWPHRHYIDLFAGAGFVQIKDSDEIIAGSPIIAANVKDPFTCLHLCEQDQARAAALEQRLAQGEVSSFRVTRGNANVAIDELLAAVPRSDALCVTFADPYGLHLEFETVKKLADIRSDLIILLADNMDALRNWARYYFDNPESNLDRFMGEGGWRAQLASANSDRIAGLIRDRYQERLRTLGYRCFGTERVRNDHGADIYTLVYASRSPRGIDFWNKASRVDEGGQRSFDF